MRSPFMPVDLGLRWKKLSEAGGNLQVRELFRFALDAAEEGSHSDETEQALIWAEELQDRDPGSETYGNFRWYRRNQKPVDRNAVEFSMEAAAVLWQDHRDVMSESSRGQLEGLIRLSVEGIRRHNVAISYTNIYIMKTWNCIGIGEGLQMADLADEGYAMLDAWLEYTSRFGIHEYLSPTYYVASMQPMELVAQRAGREAGRQKADRALRLFWVQIAANWSETCDRLAGAHSRDYDYASTGVRGERIRQRFASALKGDGETYCPAGAQETIESVMKVVPRTVCQRWGEDVQEIATTYVGNSFTLGSAGASYGPIDKCLAANLGGPETANISFFTDARGDGYGRSQFQLADGHSKALHLVPFLASVQRGSEVLFLAAPEPEGRHYHRSAPDPTCLLSHVLMPDTLETWIDGRATGTDAGEIEVSPGACLFGRLGDVAVGIRVVVARATDGGNARVHLIRDAMGAENGEMRLTVTHCEETATSRGVIALWMGMKEGLDDAGFEAFRAHFGQDVVANVDEDRVVLEVPGWESALSLEADLAQHVCLRVVGAEPEAVTALVSVNGEELGKQTVTP